MSAHPAMTPAKPSPPAGAPPGPPVDGPAQREQARIALRRQRMILLLAWAVPISVVLHLVLVVWLAGLGRGGAGGLEETVLIDLGPQPVLADPVARIPDPILAAPTTSVPPVSHSGSTAPMPGPPMPDRPEEVSSTEGASRRATLAGGLGVGQSLGAGTRDGGEVSLPTASFFGATASGRRFAFVIDLSGSMRGDRIGLALDELCRAIASLPDSCYFRVVFYNSILRIPQGPRWRRAEPEVVSDLCAHLHERVPGQADSSTNPAPAFRTVLEDNPRPDVIFFLTDGIIDPAVLNAPMVESMNLSGTPAVIHGVVFGTPDDHVKYSKSSFSRELTRMVRDTGGSARFVELEEFEP